MVGSKELQARRLQRQAIRSASPDTGTDIVIRANSSVVSIVGTGRHRCDCDRPNHTVARKARKRGNRSCIRLRGNPSKNFKKTQRERGRISARLHRTLGDRLRPARGLKHYDTAKKWLDGYVVNYNFVKPHISLKGKTPAQASGLDLKADWGELIQEATKTKTKQEIKIPIEVVTK